MDQCKAVEAHHLQGKHAAEAYTDEVGYSEKKLLEVLPVQDVKGIEIVGSLTNTSQNIKDVLKQIHTYVETEIVLKLTMKDIDKEQKARYGIGGVNNTQNTSVMMGHTDASETSQSVNSVIDTSNKQNIRDCNRWELVAFLSQSYPKFFTLSSTLRLSQRSHRTDIKNYSILF